MISRPDENIFEGTRFGGQPVNRNWIDQYTFLHILSGVLIFFVFRLFGKDWPIVALLLAIIWEIAEPMAKDWNPDIFPNPSKDSMSNKIFDVLGVMIGYYGARLVINR